MTGIEAELCVIGMPMGLMNTEIDVENILCGHLHMSNTMVGIDMKLPKSSIEGIMVE